jgi:hypothetical protein
MMITIQAGKRALGVCLLLLLVASCSREQQDWRSAEAADTIESYGQFIQRHPESELTTQARMRVMQLGEDRDWQRAGSADTADAYRQFIAQHPTGKWIQEARIRLENFSLGTQSGDKGAGESADAALRAESLPPSQAVVGSGSSGARALPGESTTVAVESALRAERPGDRGGSGGGAPTAEGGPPGNAFGVQLGAFSSEANATGQWRVLSGQFGAELQGLSERVVAADTASGRIYRLQAMGGDESRARAVCEALRKRSQGCVPVLPH